VDVTDDAPTTHRDSKESTLTITLNNNTVDDIVQASTPPVIRIDVSSPERHDVNGSSPPPPALPVSAPPPVITAARHEMIEPQASEVDVTVTDGECMVVASRHDLLRLLADAHLETS
jgi:hypothetical protein